MVLSDHATPATDASLRRLEAGDDNAIVPWVWELEVSNALGKAVMRAKLPLSRALEIWTELLLLPIRRASVAGIPELLRLAVKYDLSVYDTCYLQLALAHGLPLATNDRKLAEAAEANHLLTVTPYPALD